MRATLVMARTLKRVALKILRTWVRLCGTGNSR